ncbi:MAG: CBS domain-containing protein [Candidatus Pacearchaeota archaeon]|nr:MAG: CBS domain-containing protein [Candidatus Pacearchaeota archaeon]
MKVGIKVGDVMTRKFVSIKPDITMVECAKIMVKKGVGSVIVRSDQMLKGIVTEGDLVRAMAKSLNKKKTKVNKIMTKKVHGIKPGKDIFDALVTMKKKRVRWLPVLVNHKVIGFLTEKDILKIQPDLFDIAFQNVKIAEEEEKWKRIRAVDEFRWVREGPCHECGVFDLLYKIGNRYLCANCRRKESGQWEE